MSQNARRPRRGPSSNGASLNSTMSIVVAAVAVLLGFLILRDIGGGDSGTTTPPAEQIPTETLATDSVPSEIVTETTLQKTAFKVQVANASKVSGSAGELTTQLQGRGFIVQPAMNSSEVTPKQTATMVYFVAGSEAAAAEIAATLGGAATAPMPAPIPTETGAIGEATILILLGTDLAGKPLPAAG